LTTDDRYNIVSCLIDNGSWAFGMAFFSTTSIIPAFLSKLGAGSVIVGLVPAIMILGVCLPGTFVAGHIERMPIARKWLFPMATLERIPLLLIGILSLCINQHSALIGAFLVLIGLYSLLAGLNQPAYWKVIGKSIPTSWRGRLYGYSGLTGGILGFGVLPMTEFFFRHFSKQIIHGFGWCFIAGAGIVLVGFLPLGFVREPISVPTEHKEAKAVNLEYFHEIWKSSQGFRKFILAMSLLSVWSIASPFYMLDAIKRQHVATAEIALYTSIGVITSAFGSWLCGLISDRTGNRSVIVVASTAAFVASTLALLSINQTMLAFVFAFAAFAAAGIGLGAPLIAMEFAGSENDIPHYIGFYNLSNAAVQSVVLIGGGILSENLNFFPVFSISAIAAAVSILFTFRLSEPRHISASFEAK